MYFFIKHYLITFKCFLQLIPPSESTVLWSKSGEQGSDWMFDSVPVGHMRNFYVEYTATKGLGSQGDIALDDIKFSNCAVGPSGNLTIKSITPPSQTVGVDTNVQFTIQYDGAPLAYVTWTKDGQPLSVDRYSVAMDGM